MDIVEIEARPRESRGTRACRRLRKQGLAPAVLYGHGEANVLLSVKVADVEHLVAQRAFIVQVNWDGQQDSAQIKEVQYDALGDDVVHVDFQRISLTEMVTVSVRVELHGEPAGAAEGGVLSQQMHELEVQCLPTAIPQRLRVEVAHLGIGDDLRIKDMVFPEGVVPVEDAELVVVALRPPTEVEEEAAAEAEAPVAEPEVIGREAAKEEGEEEEEA